MKHKILYTKGLTWLLEIQEKLPGVIRLGSRLIFFSFLKIFFLLNWFFLDSESCTDFAYIKVIIVIIHWFGKRISWTLWLACLIFSSFPPQFRIFLPGEQGGATTVSLKWFVLIMPFDVLILVNIRKISLSVSSFPSEFSILYSGSWKI